MKRNESGYKSEILGIIVRVFSVFINVCMYVNYMNKTNIDIYVPHLRKAKVSVNAAYISSIPSPVCRVLPGRKSAFGSLHNCSNKRKGNLYGTHETINAGDTTIFFVLCCIYVAFVMAVLSLTRTFYE